MPEILKTNGQTDWAKLLVPIIITILGVMQGYQQKTQNQHGIELKTIVPHEEIKEIANETFSTRLALVEDGLLDKEMLISSLEDLERRLAVLEARK